MDVMIPCAGTPLNQLLRVMCCAGTGWTDSGGESSRISGTRRHTLYDVKLDRRMQEQALLSSIRRDEADGQQAAMSF
jgi:hypothetical protein